MADEHPRARVIRMPVPPRSDVPEEAREIVARLRRPTALGIRIDLVAFTDAVELDIWVGPQLRRRWRFIRDTEARKYAAELRRRLTSRGYNPTLEEPTSRLL